MGFGAVTPLEQAFSQRVLLMNVSPVNAAWRTLPDEAWGGPRLQGSPNLNITRPDLVLQWNIDLLDAGADIIETQSLFAHPLLAAEEYGADRSLRREWNLAAVELARRAANGRKFIVGGVGPGLDLLTFPPVTPSTSM